MADMTSLVSNCLRRQKEMVLMIYLILFSVLVLSLLPHLLISKYLFAGGNKVG